MPSLKNEKGFALAISLALSPVLVAALIAGYFLIGGLHLDLSAKQICRQSGIETQKQVRPLLTMLLGLNTAAKTLKAQFIFASARLAYCSANPSCLPYAVKEYHRIQKLRKNLDTKQKQIIRQANLIFRTQHQKTQWSLRAHFLKNKFSLFRIHRFQIQGQAPVLAVRPLSTGVAPSYGPVDNFIHRQSLAHVWHYNLQLTKAFTPLVAQDYRVKKSCAVSMQKESQKWTILTLKDKSLSRFY